MVQEFKKFQAIQNLFNYFLPIHYFRRSLKEIENERERELLLFWNNLNEKSKMINVFLSQIFATIYNVF